MRCFAEHLQKTFFHSMGSLLFAYRIIIALELAVFHGPGLAVCGVRDWREVLSRTENLSFSRT